MTHILLSVASCSAFLEASLPPHFLMKKIFAAALFASLAFIHVQAVTVSFDTPGDLANNFSLNGTSGYYVQLTGSGINNTGSVAPNQTSGTASAILNTVSFNGSLSATVTEAIFFK